MTSKSAGQRNRSAQQSMTESFAAFGERDTYLAITGRGDTDKTVLVTNRPGFIYVRLPKKVVTGTLEEYTETQAYSQNEYRHGVPVTVQKSEENPSRYEVIDTWKVGMGEAVLQAVTQNVAHHRTSHEVYSTVGGHDPIMLDTIQLRNLQVSPTSPPSSRVKIDSGWYTWKHGGVNWFDGIEYELSDNVPTGTLSYNYVSLWLDPTTDEIVTREHTNLGLAAFKQPLSDLVEWPVEDYIPLAAVRLTAGDYVIRWQANNEPNFTDMRPHQSMMPGDMLPAGHPLDPDGGRHTGTLQAAHVAYNDSSGTYAGDNVQDILNEVRDTARGSSGTLPVEEDDLLVMGAVRLNFEGDPFYDMNVIDEGAGKATITGSFDTTQLETGLNELYVRRTGDVMTGDLNIITQLIVPTIVGGTGSGDDLTLQSTGHTTKGSIIFGTASAYDEVNDRLGLGNLTPDARLDIHVATATELGLVVQTTDDDATNNLLEIQDSAGDNLVEIDNVGRIGIGINPKVGLHLLGPNGEIRLQQVETDAAIKFGRLTVAHYTNAEQSVLVFNAGSLATSTEVLIGGGSGVANAATVLKLITAPTNTTLTGTARLTIDSTGNVLVNGFTAPTVGLTVKGAPAHSASLQEWQDSSANILVNVGATGTLETNRDRVKSTETSTGTATMSDIVEIHICNSASPYTLTLATHKTDKEIRIINIGAGTVTLSPTSGNIKGSATETLAQWESIILISDNTDWI